MIFLVYDVFVLSPGPALYASCSMAWGQHKHVPQRVQYKLAVMVHRCLGRRAPSYFADYCVPVSTVPGLQHLRSASHRQLIVPHVRHSTFGARAFAIAGPTVWNSLPDSLRDPAVGPDQFRRDLKTHLFE